MATVLFVSKQGDGVPVALRMAAEGHIVKMWFRNQKARRSLQGFRNPSVVPDYRKLLDQYDLVVADMVGLGEVMDNLAERGKVVLGGGSFADKMELDRDYGVKVVQSLTKLHVPPTTLAKDKKEAIACLEQAGWPCVIKPLGNKPTNLTLVTYDAKNRPLITLLEHYPQADALFPCLIQKRVEGVEVSTEGWFDGKDWVLPFNHTIEHKRFMEHDKGCQTGCMGNVVWATDGDKLVATALAPLAPLLERVGYVGPIDVNCIVDEDKAWFLEFTCRYGYDAIQAWCELLKMPVFDYMYKVATGTLKEAPVYRNAVSIAIRLSVPPWPYKDDASELEGVKFVDVPKEAMPHVWLSDVMQVDGELRLAGVDGVIGCVTARGEDIREARRRAYRTVGNVVIHPDVQYRQDIGLPTEQKIKQLKEWGWIV